MFSILLVEDAEESKKLVFDALKSDEMQVTWCSTLDIAWRWLRENKVDLILLDIQLPDGNGFQFYSMLQRNDDLKEIPVVFLTANDDVSGKILGFSLGADDYVSKPFHPVEFKTRVELRLKKSQKRKSGGHAIRKGSLLLQVPYQKAFAELNGSKVDLGLTPIEFKILAHLLDHDEIIMSRDRLITAVWGDGIHVTDRTIDTHIYTLRKKLGELADCIEAVYGQGYRFTLSPKLKEQAT